MTPKWDMRHLSIIAFWHLNYEKISVRCGSQWNSFQIIHKFERSFIVMAENARKKIRFCQYMQPIFRQILLQWTSTMLFLKVYALVKPLTVFHIKKFLSHVNTLLFICPIIANKYIPGSHASLLCKFNCYALGCLVVFCKKVGEQMVQIL